MPTPKPLPHYLFGEALLKTLANSDSCSAALPHIKALYGPDSPASTPKPLHIQAAAQACLDALWALDTALCADHNGSTPMLDPICQNLDAVIAVCSELQIKPGKDVAQDDNEVLHHKLAEQQLVSALCFVNEADEQDHYIETVQLRVVAAKSWHKQLELADWTEILQLPWIFDHENSQLHLACINAIKSTLKPMPVCSYAPTLNARLQACINESGLTVLPENLYLQHQDHLSSWPWGMVEMDLVVRHQSDLENSRQTQNMAELLSLLAEAIHFSPSI